MTFRTLLLKETTNARLIRHEGREIWLPRSQIESMTTLQAKLPENARGQPVELTIPGWLAAVKGISE